MKTDKTTAKRNAKIVAEYKKGKTTQTALAKKYGISAARVSQLVARADRQAEADTLNDAGFAGE